MNYWTKELLGLLAVIGAMGILAIWYGSEFFWWSTLTIIVGSLLWLPVDAARRRSRG